MFNHPYKKQSVKMTSCGFYLWWLSAGLFPVQAQELPVVFPSLLQVAGQSVGLQEGFYRKNKEDITC